MSIELSNFLFLDIETTGLRPDRGARITEIAIYSRSQQIEVWRKNKNEFIESNLEPVILKIVKELKKGVLVGHNLKFDLKFLAYYAERLGIRGFKVNFIDTLGLAKSLLNSKNGYTLAALLKKFDISVEGSLHTAAVDTEATRALFWKLVNLGNIETLSDAGIKRIDWTTF